MSTTINNIFYSITSYTDRTASVGIGKGDSNAVKGTLNGNVFFEEFVEISGVKYEVTNISRRAFRLNKDIKTLIINSKIRIIEGYAFDQCYNIESVTFTEGSKLKIIERTVFYNCSLKTIIIPGSVKSIDENAFVACDKLAYFFYCGRHKIDSRVFDFIDQISNTTPQNLKIYVSSRYNSDTLGQRGVSVRNYDSCFFKKCTQLKTNRAISMNILLLISLLQS